MCDIGSIFHHTFKSIDSVKYHTSIWDLAAKLSYSIFGLASAESDNSEINTQSN